MPPAARATTYDDDIQVERRREGDGNHVTDPCINLGPPAIAAHSNNDILSTFERARHAKMPRCVCHRHPHHSSRVTIARLQLNTRIRDLITVRP